MPRNIEVIWLLRTLKPDFKTIADFRSDNRAARRINCRGTNRRWMKVQWQVKVMEKQACTLLT